MRFALLLLLMPLAEAFIMSPSKLASTTTTQLSMARYRGKLTESMPDYSTMVDKVTNSPPPDTPPPPPEPVATVQEKVAEIVNTPPPVITSTKPKLSEQLPDLFKNRDSLKFQVRDDVPDAVNGAVSKVKALLGSQDFDLPSFKTEGGGDYTAAFNDLVERLNLPEYGLYYLAGFVVFLVVAQGTSGGSSASKAAMDGKLADAERKAQEAAEAASVAAQGATMAKKMASEAELKSGEYLLEATKVKAIQVEKELMAKEIENLKAETAKLKAQLEAATAKAPAAAATTTKTAAAAAPKQVLARDPDEDKKILNIIKEKDTENQKTGLKTKKGPKKVAAKAEESEELFFGEPLKPKASSKSATKKAAKKVTEKAATKTASKSDDWSTLSMSTLKRKTVKDLSDYLSERGVEVTHDDGKPMKKAELVSAVQSLQEA